MSDTAALDDDCKKVVLDRMAEQNLDIRFNPALEAACSLDIPKFCKEVVSNWLKIYLNKVEFVFKLRFGGTRRKGAN